jgi:lipoate-protein ligase A
MGGRRPWRLLIDPPGSAARNMSVDEALLACAADSPPTLRLYTWRRPSISLGYRQPRPDWLGRSGAAGIEVVRRVSGGGSVVHAGDLTYAVVACAAQADLPSGPRGSYEWIRAALIEALRSAGLDARRSAGAPRAARLELCFAGATGFEVELDGCKLVGSAQRRTRWGFLQHGSIRLADDSAVYREVIGCEPPPLPPLPPLALEQATRAVAAGFARALGQPLEAGELSAAERAVLRARRALRAADPLAAPPVSSSHFPQVADTVA